MSRDQWPDATIVRSLLGHASLQGRAAELGLEQAQVGGTEVVIGQPPDDPAVTGAHLLEEGGPLLGALEGAEFQSGELMLEPGDTLVAYSDGVLECRNNAGEEFGLDRLMASFLETKQQSAQATLMMLLAAVQDFANGNPLLDDVSLTLIQRDAETNIDDKACAIGC